MSVVVDASVTLDWFFKSERTPFGNRVLMHALRHGCAVPFNWPSEVAHGLVQGIRKKELQRNEAERAMEMLRSVDARVDQPDWRVVIPRLFGLAETHNMSAYDAAYLEVAARLRLSVATKDGAMRRAARDEGIELFRE